MSPPTGTDPTGGLVKYLPKAAAKASNLSHVQSDGQYIMRVDTTEVQPQGRPSVRITSNQTYSDGVYVLNTSHVPTGCSVWPSFWMVPPDTQNYPQGGEIDIYENANDQFNGNLVSLHTGGDCSFNPSQQHQTGITSFTNCTVDYSTGNEGCRVEMNQTTVLGGKSTVPTTNAALNKAQGGLFAMERDLSSNGTGIRVWFFPHDQVPNNLKSGSQEVDTGSWGQAAVDFPVTSCASSFGKMSMVFDITLCGAWAGATYAQSGCTANFSACSAQVGQNGSSYKEAYWAVNDVRAFSKAGGASSDAGGHSSQKGIANTIHAGSSALFAIALTALGVALL